MLFPMCKDYASSGLGVASATGAAAVSTSSPPSSLWGISADPLENINSSTLFGSGSSYGAPQAVGSVGRAGRPSSMRLRITNAFVISAIGWRVSVCFAHYTQTRLYLIITASRGISGSERVTPTGIAPGAINNSRGRSTAIPDSINSSRSVAGSLAPLDARFGMPSACCDIHSGAP